MRRLILLLILSAATFSTGCIAAVPLLIYAAKNRQASAVEPPSAFTPNAVQTASHSESALAQPSLMRPALVKP